MDGFQTNQDWWSIESIEKSVNQKFTSLKLNTSGGSYDEDDSKIARGHPELKKSVSQSGITKKNSSQRKQKTSSYVLPILKDVRCNLDLSVTSGYYSSLSPTESSLFKFIPITSPYSMASSTNFQCNEYQETEATTLKNESHRSTKRFLKNIIKGRLNRKNNSKNDNEQYIFEFGDTNLIKCCRRGQVSGVQEALDQLTKSHQLALIDHKNSANETALSIATYQMNEILIKLLIKYDASSTIPLAMNNNVLHIAAAMTGDVERRTLKYLIQAIDHHQPESLFVALTDRNIFNFDVCQILQCHQTRVVDLFEAQCLQSHIDSIQYSIKAFYML